MSWETDARYILSKLDEFDRRLSHQETLETPSVYETVHIHSLSVQDGAAYYYSSISFPDSDYPLVDFQYFCHKIFTKIRLYTYWTSPSGISGNIVVASELRIIKVGGSIDPSVDKNVSHTISLTGDSNVLQTYDMNLDHVAANDSLNLRLYRPAPSADDTLAAAAYLNGIGIVLL